MSFFRSVRFSWIQRTLQNFADTKITISLVKGNSRIKKIHGFTFSPNSPNIIPSGKNTYTVYNKLKLVVDNECLLSLLGVLSLVFLISPPDGSGHGVSRILET